MRLPWHKKRKGKLAFSVIWLTFWIGLAVGIWYFFVTVTAGGLDGIVHIDTIDIRFFGTCERETPTQNACLVGYELEGEEYLFRSETGSALPVSGNTALPLGELEENEWEAFFELPSHYFDRQICGRLEGPGAPNSTITILLNEQRPDVADLRITHGEGCVPFVDDGEQLFTIENHSLASIEFSDDIRRRVQRILERSISNFEEGEIDVSEIDDLHFEIHLTSELIDSSGLKIIYFIALIITLHPIVLVIEYSAFVGEGLKLLLDRYFK